ncbi:hypothetical protein [Nonomuraea turcica]|uniref:hypothetical protein n=1 Tax=Nonomuraea sp. G32 TaxID=3067274 RepID=UPI00273B02C5|nr:hypothetical protein [Nonomuraea sp. G32]MDP4503792.1 hypothetical protein [Nonomuraea sp. G32]
MGITANPHYIVSHKTAVVAYCVDCDVWVVSDIPDATFDGESALRYMMLNESQYSLGHADHLITIADKAISEMRAILSLAAGKARNREAAAHMDQVGFLLALTQLILNDAPSEELSSRHTCQNGNGSVFSCAKCLRYLLSGLEAEPFKRENMD